MRDTSHTLLPMIIRMLIGEAVVLSDSIDFIDAPAPPAPPSVVPSSFV